MTRGVGIVARLVLVAILAVFVSATSANAVAAGTDLYRYDVSPKVVAAVHGYALGVGASTTPASDSRVAHQFARPSMAAASRSSMSSISRRRAAKAGRAGLDDLAAAARASSRGGQTAAGRAVQKHGDRPGSIYPRVGSSAERSRIGQGLVEDYLTHPQARERVRRDGVRIFELPDGRWVSFNADDTFRGFLEPRP